MSLTFEIRMTDLLGHELERAELRVPIKYMTPTDERLRLGLLIRDKAIEIAKLYSTEKPDTRIEVSGRKVKPTDRNREMTTTWIEFEILNRQGEIVESYRQGYDYLLGNGKKSGKR